MSWKIERYVPGGLTLQSLCTKRLRLEFQSLTLIYITFLTENVPLSYTFHWPFKWCPFHTPSLEHALPFTIFSSDKGQKYLNPTKMTNKTKKEALWNIFQIYVPLGVRCCPSMSGEIILSGPIVFIRLGLESGRLFEVGAFSRPGAKGG